MYGKRLLNNHLKNPFDCTAFFCVLRHAEICDNMVISMEDCAINDKLLKELTDILSNSNGKLQVQELSLRQTKLSDKGVADRASASFTALDGLFLYQNNFTDIMSSFVHTSCTSLTELKLPHNPLGVSGIQSLETAVQSGALINLWRLELSNTLTDDADVNGALLHDHPLTVHCLSLCSTVNIRYLR